MYDLCIFVDDLITVSSSRCWLLETFTSICRSITNVDKNTFYHNLNDASFFVIGWK